MIVVTGAAGFIGSCLVSKLNEIGITNIIAVDDFSKHEKDHNLSSKIIFEKIERNEFSTWLKDNHNKIDFVFHIGARTDTTEFNREILNELNLNYTKKLWEICTEFKLPFVYASSAATYGLGEFGYEDKDNSLPEKLKPLNPYGDSKNDFDKWALRQTTSPPYWIGLKFFNVYGPNEYHKGRMASVIFHAFHQIKKSGKMKLFKSHNPNYKDGGQLRDFIYVKDVVNVCLFLKNNRIANGLYNLGTGKARTFEDLAKCTFQSMNINSEIEFIDTPEDIRDKYQYYTEANMSKLIEAGYSKKFYTLEEGIQDYVKNYLEKNNYL